MENKVMTKAEMDALSAEAASRQLTKDEVLALHEAARKMLDQAEQMDKPLREVDIWKHMTPRPYLDNIEYHMVDHCNLNCAACGHFSNLADKHFADLEKFRADYRRFVSVMGDKLKGLILMGGEPLLHPNIEQFIVTAREIYPNGTIDMFTNGLLLKKMPRSFWDTCAACGLQIIFSSYPTNVNVDEIQELANNYGVRLSIVSRHEENWVYWPLDLEGKHSITKNFILCSQANNCHQLKDGRVYPCSTAAYIEYFNKTFGMSLELCDEDSLDIFKEGVTGQDVLDFLSRPVPFCRYCNRETFKMTTWKASKKIIDEWLDTYDPDKEI